MPQFLYRSVDGFKEGSITQIRQRSRSNAKKPLDTIEEKKENVDNLKSIEGIIHYKELDASIYPKDVSPSVQIGSSKGKPVKSITYQNIEADNPLGISFIPSINNQSPVRDIIRNQANSIALAPNSVINNSVDNNNNSNYQPPLPHGGHSNSVSRPLDDPENNTFLRNISSVSAANSELLTVAEDLINRMLLVRTRMFNR